MKKRIKKITFSLSKVNFSLLKQILKKVDFFYFRSHERLELPAHRYVPLTTEDKFGSRPKSLKAM